MMQCCLGLYPLGEILLTHMPKLHCWLVSLDPAPHSQDRCALMVKSQGHGMLELKRTLQLSCPVPKFHQKEELEVRDAE